METLIEQAFAQVVQNSVSGSLLIAFFLLAVWLLRENVSALVTTLFAVVILVRLALPVVPEIGMSFLSWSPDRLPGKGEPELALVTVEQPRLTTLASVSRETYLDTPVSGTVTVQAGPVLPEVVAEPSSAMFRLPSLATIWAAGSLLMIGVIGLQHLRLAGRVRKGKGGGSAELEAILAETCLQLGLRQKVSISVLGGVASPMLFGIWKPRLLLPESFEHDFTRKEVQAIFLHELAHLRRWDLGWNWFACGVLCLHWFNPLVWILIRRFRFDREKLCDRYVVSLLPEKTFYSSTLLKAVRLLAVPDRNAVTLHPGTSSIFTRKSEIKQRLLMIQNPPRPSSFSKAFLFSTFCLALLFSLPAGGEDGKERRDSSSGDRSRETERGNPEREARRDGDRDAPKSRETRGDRDMPESREKRGDREHPERVARGDGGREVAPERRDTPDARHREKNEREEIDHHLREMHNALANTRRAGRHEEAEAIERRIREMEEHRERLELPREVSPPGPDVRLHHLHLAAENLERAGLLEEAGRYRDQARRLEEEMRRAHHSREGAERAGHLEREVRELREMVGDLQHQIRELHEQLGRERDR